MTYTDFISNSEIKVLEYNKYSDFNENINRFKFHVKIDDVEDFYYICNHTMVAEPDYGRHKESYKIGLHLRNIADDIISSIKFGKIK